MTPARAEAVKLIYEAAKAQEQSKADRDKLTPYVLGAFVKGSEWDKWASTLEASLGRYVLENQEPEYSTKTCKVFIATDMKKDTEEGYTKFSLLQKVRNTPLR